jgi:type II secretory pathway pseudopilin PulG
MHKPNRNGLSALDVVVTIVILLILAALLLPSVRVSGGASRRSQCKNNLKQIGLSLMNYHDVHRTFPPGWIASETKGRSSGFGWGYQVLPYFDQKPLFEKFDAKRKLSDQTSGNDDLAKTILTAMRCPSDDGPDQAKSNWMPLLGTTNYVGNFGVGIPITYFGTRRIKRKPRQPSGLSRYSWTQFSNQNSRRQRVGCRMSCWLVNDDCRRTAPNGHSEESKALSIVIGPASRTLARSALSPS